MSKYKFDPSHYKKELRAIITRLLDLAEVDEKSFAKILKENPKDTSEIFSKDQLIRAVYYFFENKLIDDLDEITVEEIISRIKMKPTRSISGVTTVTILTKPFACPGKCIFCPNDVRMPKSYIASEPGAQRALDNRFDPYLQVYGRLLAYKNIGHPIDKIELLILGGTWSYYTKKYKIWFIHQCFKAMNEFGSNHTVEIYLNNRKTKLKHPKTIEEDELNTKLRKKYGDIPYNQLIQKPEYKIEFEKSFVVKESEVYMEQLTLQQNLNSKGKVRCVGLVLETRSDVITPAEVLLMRKLGATKVQLGIQTLDDEISKLNERGETIQQVANAFRLLRAGGFKIHAHIMPNLYGATIDKDFEVYRQLFDDKRFKPDELKIYPTSIIKWTKLYQLWEQGKYKPYTSDELIELLANCIEYTPAYCRLTRIIRDIPSTEIADGNMTTNLREVVEYKLKKEGRKNHNIRAREIRAKKVNIHELVLDEVRYEAYESDEIFLQYVNQNFEIAGFLRLSIPHDKKNLISDELDDCTIIREVHVYGPALEIDSKGTDKAQHIGLGTLLIQRAKEISRGNGFNKVAVISAIGTREYYFKRGFTKLGDWMIAHI
jgi:elongator complex protein 3